MSCTASVIICTHNPRRSYLDKVLDALKKQSLATSCWELIIVDNASDDILAPHVSLEWHPNARHVREEKLGLTMARLRGIEEAATEILVFVDDDNVLDLGYLQHTIDILRDNPQLGAIGGKCLPEFEVEPEPWFADVGVPLGLRDLGDEEQVCHWINESIETGKTVKQYPEFAPIGAGMVLRKQAARIYVDSLTENSARLALGRTGKQLTSGEDNDIVLTLLEAGWGIGYFPQLQLRHLISRTRLTRNYLARLNYASSRSWVQVLSVHGIQPWHKIPAWTVLPRKVKAFFFYQPWKSPVAQIHWQGACGLIEGRSEIL